MNENSAEILRALAPTLPEFTGFPVDHASFDRASNALSGLGTALVEMGMAAVKTKLAALTLEQALAEFNRLYPRPSRFYRKRRTRSMRGK